jgi:histidine phosphotransferase ChpT
MMGGETPGSAQRFAELVAARLCHDMSGPLSIIANAAELAKLEGGREGGEAMGLMLEGAREIAARVKLLRALFGPATGPLSAADVAALVRGTLGGGRVEADLSALAPGTVFRPEIARVVLAALVVAAEALPRGGTVRLHGGAADFAVSIDGQNAAWPTHLTEVLAGAEPLTAAVGGGPRGLMGPYLVLAAREAGLAPALLMGAGTPLLRFAGAAG